jgi:Trypsin-like peptidase domain
MVSVWDDRLAEVWAPPGHVGSGVVVGGYGVLTARHVVAEVVEGSVAGPVLARVVREGGPQRWVPMRVVAADAEWDLAVFEVDRNRPEAVAWVRPGSQSPVVVHVGGTSVDGCEAVGFPDEEVQHPEGARPGAAVRQSEQLRGTLLPRGQAKSPVAPRRRLPRNWMPLDVSTATPGGQAGWRGMSGAGVLLPDGRLAGVVVAAQARHQRRRLFVVPLAVALDQSSDLVTALAEVVGGPLVAEALSAPLYRSVLYRESVGEDGLPRRLAEITDLGVFGVKPVDLAGEPPYLNYVPRDDDGRLVMSLGELAGKRMLMLVGDSGSGKSRSLAQATSDKFPAHRFLRPIEHQFPLLLQLPLTDLGPTLVWLDDVEKYAHPAMGETLEQLLALDIVVVATIRREELAALTTAGEIHNPSGEALADERLVKHFGWKREWSQAERDRTSRYVTNSLPLQAVNAGLPLGVWAVAGPQLVQLLDFARSDEDYPYRFALVRAVLDWYRTGLTTPMPKSALGDLINAYLDQRASDADISDAITWCTRPVAIGGRRAQYSLLTIEYDGLAINDYVQDHDRRHDPPPIPGPTWSAALANASGTHSLTALGIAAYCAGQAQTARTAFNALAVVGDTSAMFNLGLLLKDVDQDESQYWYRRARATAHIRLSAIHVGP